MISTILNDDQAKPCPFCGGRAVLLEDFSLVTRILANGMFYRVKCLTCDFFMPWHKTDTLALKEWNRRNEK